MFGRFFSLVLCRPKAIAEVFSAAQVLFTDPKTDQSYMAVANIIVRRKGDSHATSFGQTCSRSKGGSSFHSRAVGETIYEPIALLF